MFEEGIALMGAVTATEWAIYSLFPLSIGATVLMGYWGLNNHPFGLNLRSASRAIPVLFHFNQGNLTTADMHVLQRMKVESINDNQAVLSGDGDLAELNMTKLELRDNGLAHGKLSVAMGGENGGVGSGSYIIVARSNETKADEDVLAAYAALHQLLSDVDDGERAGLTPLVKLLFKKEH